MANLISENDRLLDIVDNKDIIMGSRSRAEIHRLGLLHREIHVWMFDENRNIFFQKRGLPVSMSGLFDATAGGHINKGEDYLDAAIRETKEETSITISPADLIFLKKSMGTEYVSREDSLGTINNFIRSVYIYKYPIKEQTLRKEPVILGVNFKKFSYAFLQDISKRDSKMFIKFVLTDELPSVLKYVNQWKKD